MKNIWRTIMGLPIRWKLTIWSALMICTIILSYNLVQFFVLNNWLQQYEVQYVENTMDDLLGYYHSDKSNGMSTNEIQSSKAFIYTAIEKNEMIRILDKNGVPQLTVTHGVPTDWVKPQAVNARSIVSVMHHDEHLIVDRAPLQTGSFTGTIEIVRNVMSIDDLIQLILTFVLSGAVGAIFLAGVGGFILSRQMLGPVKTLTDTMKSIRGGGLDERVPVLNNGDELSDLSAIFNEMMDRVEKSFQQQKQFIEDASHELRTPLAVLEGHLSMLKRWGKNDPDILDESLEAITQETKRLQGLVKELLDLTRAETMQKASQMNTNVRSVLEHVVYNLEVLYPDYHFGKQFSELDHLEIPILSDHLEQMLFIILDNAIKYSNQTKRIDIAVFPEGRHCVIQVVDHGEGIPAKDLPYIFDRFYRVDKARSRKVGGNGLGLSIAQRLMSFYHGEIRVVSEEGEGTRVQLRFPVDS